MGRNGNGKEKERGGRKHGREEQEQSKASVLLVQLRRFGTGPPIIQKSGGRRILFFSSSSYKIKEKKKREGARSTKIESQTTTKKKKSRDKRLGSIPQKCSAFFRHGRHTHTHIKTHFFISLYMGRRWPLIIIPRVPIAPHGVDRCLYNYVQQARASRRTAKTTTTTTTKAGKIKKWLITHPLS